MTDEDGGRKKRVRETMARGTPGLPQAVEGGAPADGVREKKRHDEYAAKIEKLKKEPEKLAAYRAQNCANAKAYKERLRADPEKWQNYLAKRREYRKRQRERERAERDRNEHQD